MDLIRLSLMLITLHNSYTNPTIFNHDTQVNIDAHFRRVPRRVPSAFPGAYADVREVARSHIDVCYFCNPVADFNRVSIANCVVTISDIEVVACKDRKR